MNNWYKTELALEGGRAHRTLMRELGAGWNEALGILHSWITYINLHTDDGKTGLLPAELDSVLHYTPRNAGALQGAGGCNAPALQFSAGCNAGVFDGLEKCGWVELDERGEVCAVEFEQHNSKSARNKALTSKRVENHRANAGAKKCNAGALQGAGGCNAPALPDKNRIEENLKESRSLSRAKEKAASGLVEDAMQEPPERKAKEGLRPADVEEVENYLATLPMLRLTPEQKGECARAWYCEMEAVGWVDKAGRNVWRWKPHAQNYATRWAENLHRVPMANGKPGAKPSRNTGTINDRDHSNYAEL